MVVADAVEIYGRSQQLLRFLNRLIHLTHTIRLLLSMLTYKQPTCRLWEMNYLQQYLQ